MNGRKKQEALYQSSNKGWREYFHVLIIRLRTPFVSLERERFYSRALLSRSIWLSIARLMKPFTLSPMLSA